MKLGIAQMHWVLMIGVLSIAAVAASAHEEVFKVNGLELTFRNDDPTLPIDLQKRMVQTFFKVYPVLVSEFNEHAPSRVTIFIDPTYRGVAEAGGSRIRINPKWMHDHPEDLDVITHEAMHLVQQYPGRSGPSWITEGIADYVRSRYGINNEAGGWSLPAFRETQSYTDSYRVTARFFVWLEMHADVGLIKTLDEAMRSGTYTEDFWRTQTGKTIDELWDAYAKDPSF